MFILPFNVVLIIPFKFIIDVCDALPMFIVPALIDKVPISDKLAAFINGADISNPASLEYVAAPDDNILILDWFKLLVVKLIFLLLILFLTLSWFVCILFVTFKFPVIVLFPVDVIILQFKLLDWILPIISKFPVTLVFPVASRVPCILLFPYAFNELQSNALLIVVLSVANDAVWNCVFEFNVLTFVSIPTTWPCNCPTVVVKAPIDTTAPAATAPAAVAAANALPAVN